MKAVKEVIPSLYEQDIVFTTETLQGYYTNPIIMVKTIIRKNPIITAFIENLSTKLGVDDKGKLLLKLENHLNGKGPLYLRFDKQEAYLGNLKLGQSDPIHVKIRFQKKLAELEDVHRMFGLSARD